VLEVAAPGQAVAVVAVATLDCGQNKRNGISGISTVLIISK
jgi:hypothetical protein